MRHGVETVVEEGAEAVRTCKAHQKKLYILSNYPEAHFMRNMKEYDFSAFLTAMSFRPWNMR